MENIDKELFTHVGKNLENAEQIKRPSLSYFKDALRRIKKNKPAIISFWVLIFMILASIAGPYISKAAKGHTFNKQTMSKQNQTIIMNNKRSLTLKKNGVFKYEKYNSNPRRNETVFKGVYLKYTTGLIEYKVGDKSEESLQGDKKEFVLKVKVDKADDLKTIVQKFNEASDKLLKEDPDFRGVKMALSGSTITVKSQGETWLNKDYWFGSDQFGRDLFTRLWSGGRISFTIAFLSVIATMVIGVLYGGVAGYFGGKIDLVMMRIVEVIMVVPDLLYIILLLQVLDPGLKPIILVLALTSWMGTARIVRGEVLKLKSSEYILAAETLGANPSRIILRHLIPNAMGPIIVNATMMIPAMIFAEAFLSFIGLGIPIPDASWGSLINDGARLFKQYPEQLLIPAAVMSITMLAFNILGDGLRDALDPKLRK